MQYLCCSACTWVKKRLHITHWNGHRYGHINPSTRVILDTRTMWNICKPHSLVPSHAFTLYVRTASANELQCKTNWLSLSARICMEFHTPQRWCASAESLSLLIDCVVYIVWCDLCRQVFQMWTNFDRGTIPQSESIYMLATYSAVTSVRSPSPNNIYSLCLRSDTYTVSIII